MKPSLQDQRVFAVLLCCARTQWSSVHQTRLTDLIQEGIVWEDLLRQSVFHSVCPLLYTNLMSACAEAVPTDVRDEFQQQAQAAAIYGALQATELGKVLRLFESHGLPAITFKGPTLAQRAYGNVGARPYSDLDILIRKTDFNEARRLLQGLGYRPHEKMEGLSPFYEKVYLWLSRQYPFSLGAHVFNVDLHVDLMPPLYAFEADFETLWQRTVLVPMNGGEMRCFAAEDLLYILCYHGVKNRWEALKHVCDVAELVQATPTLDWERVVARARQTRGERILYLGLYLARHLLGLSLPADVEQAIEQPQVQRIGTRLLERLPGQMNQGMAGFNERLRFHLATQETLATKARYGGIALLRRMVGLFPQEVAIDWN